MKPGSGDMDSRSVIKDQLGIGRILDSEDAGPGCLRFFRDNGNLFTQDTVKKSRLADVRFAKDGNEARLERIHSREMPKYSNGPSLVYGVFSESRADPFEVIHRITTSQAAY